MEHDVVQGQDARMPHRQSVDGLMMLVVAHVEERHPAFLPQLVARHRVPARLDVRRYGLIRQSDDP